MFAKLKFPKGLNLKKRNRLACDVQPRLKISISLESSNLNLLDSTQKIGFGGCLAWSFEILNFFHLCALRVLQKRSIKFFHLSQPIVTWRPLVAWLDLKVEPVLGAPWTERSSQHSGTTRQQRTLNESRTLQWLGKHLLESCYRTFQRDVSLILTDMFSWKGEP